MKRTTGKRVMRAPEASEASGARLPDGRAAVVFAGITGVLAWTFLGDPVEVHGPASNQVQESPRAPSPSVQVASPVEATPAAWDRDFMAWVERKYRYLLVDADLPEAKRKRLMQLLLEREQAVSEAAIRKTENELRGLLPAASHATFQLLKDSDEEQHHLLEYTGGASHAAPLTAEQQRAVLEIKLRHKQAYQMALAESGIDRETLSVAEREYAHRLVAAAVSAYLNEYLQAVRPMLEDEQYALLSNYETTEFTRELQRLQMILNAK